MDIKCNIKSLEVKPGEMFVVEVDSNSRATVMGDVIRFAKGLAKIYPEIPIAITFPEYKLGMVGIEEFNKEYKTIDVKEIEGQITLDEYMKEKENKNE